MRAVIFVGGKGMRLRPLTEELPKPLLPVGRKPILQTIIERLRSEGFTDICLATGYKADLIESYFGDGRNFDVSISYTREPQPLGTAGALRLSQNGRKDPLLAMNGDLLTKVSFGAMRQFHEERGADLTVAVKRRRVPIRFGVVELHDHEVMGFREKPVLDLDVYAGIAILEPWTVDLIPEAQPYNIPDLVAEVKRRRGRVVAYPMDEFWLDIGEMSDYEAANKLAQGWERL
ncbi:MAG: sugar phosphate nucleotidyltransferase [Armatimonadota bacterium]